MGKFGKTLYVEYVTSRVGDCFAKYALGVRTESSLDFLVVPAVIDECALDAELLHRNAEEIECASVDGIACNEVVAGLADVENCIEIGSLS